MLPIPKHTKISIYWWYKISLVAPLPLQCIQHFKCKWCTFLADQQRKNVLTECIFSIKVHGYVIFVCFLPFFFFLRSARSVLWQGRSENKLFSRATFPSGKHCRRRFHFGRRGGRGGRVRVPGNWITLDRKRVSCRVECQLRKRESPTDPKRPIIHFSQLFHFISRNHIQSIPTAYVYSIDLPIIRPIFRSILFVCFIFFIYLS